LQSDSAAKPFLLSLREAAATKQSRFYKDKIRLPRSLFLFPSHKKLTGKQLLGISEEAATKNNVIITDEFKGYNLLDYKNYVHLRIDHTSVLLTVMFTQTTWKVFGLR